MELKGKQGYEPITIEINTPHDFLLLYFSLRTPDYEYLAKKLGVKFPAVVASMDRLMQPLSDKFKREQRYLERYVKEHKAELYEDLKKTDFDIFKLA